MSKEHNTAAWRELRTMAAQIARRDDTPCCRCGQPIDYSLPSISKEGLTIDHLVPVGAGGDLLPSLDGLAPAHRSCNSRYGKGPSREQRHRYREGVVSKGVDAFARRMSEMPQLAVVEPLPTESRSVRNVGLSTEEQWQVPWLRDLLEMPDTAVWPRVMTKPHPNAVDSLGWAVVERIEKRRLSDPTVPRNQKLLRWWQKLVLVRAYEIDAEGKLCWGTIIISTPRQVGKSVTLRELALDRISQFQHYGEAQLAIHIAKDASIANEIQLPARQWAAIMEREGYPWHPVGGSGHWAVEYEGYMGRWLIRSRFGVYGYSASLAIIDEAWHLEQSVVEEGIEPTMIEREQPQLWLFSTAHAEATTLMRNKRARAFDTMDDPEEIMIIEWSALPGASRFDVEGMRLASPYWDERRQKFLSSRTGQNGFEEQWLNIWPAEKQAPGWISPEIWNKSALPAASLPTSNRRDYGLTFCIYPDGLQTEWNVVAAWKETIEDEEYFRVMELGIMSSRKDAIALVADQATGRSVSLIVPRVLRGRFPKTSGIRQIILAGESDIAAATTTMRPIIQTGRLKHTGSEKMTDHMLRAVSEKWGDTIRLSSKLSGGPIEMAKAIVLAGWWAGRDERRKGIIA